MKHIFFGLSTCIALSTTAISADNYESYQDNEYTCCESQSGKGVIMGDFLYWKANTNGLDYCFSTGFTEETIGGTTVYNFNSDIKNPNSKWDPGYRVGAAWQFSESELEIGAVWTHFDTKASTSVGIQNLHWKLDFDTVDVVAGYQIWNNCPVGLKVFGGVRLAEIDQKTRSFRVNDFLAYSKQDNNKQDFRGAGPLIGFAAYSDVGCGFGLYLDAAVAALYGCYHTHFTNTITRVDDIRTQNIHQHTNAYLGALDAGVGIKWGKEFCNGKVAFVKLGAELHRYFSYNRLGDHDDLCLDGGRLSLGFVF